MNPFMFAVSKRAKRRYNLTCRLVSCIGPRRSMKHWTRRKCPCECRTESSGAISMPRVLLFGDDAGHEKLIKGLLDRLASEHATQVVLEVRTSRAGHGRML